MEDGLVRPVDEGTPQGGPLSPLLSNLVLDDLDKELSRRGHRFCRYADDCNIYVRSRRSGERVMASVTRFLTQKLKLKVNEAKSAVAQPEERKFLGFTITNDGAERRIAPKALSKFKMKIRDMTCRTRGQSLEQIVKDLAPYLIGWRGYFGFCQTPRVLTQPGKHGYAGDYARISGGSGETAITASRNCAAVASRSSTPPPSSIPLAEPIYSASSWRNWKARTERAASSLRWTPSTAPASTTPARCASSPVDRGIRTMTTRLRRL